MEQPLGQSEAHLDVAQLVAGVRIARVLQRALGRGARDLDEAQRQSVAARGGTRGWGGTGSVSGIHAGLLCRSGW